MGYFYDVALDWCWAGWRWVGVNPQPDATWMLRVYSWRPAATPEISGW